MANKPTFTLPEGLELDLEGDSLSVRYDGSVSLSHSMGRQLASLHAEGDIDLSLDKATGTISGGGTVEISADVDAEVIHGRVVRLTGATIKCKAISATERIEIAASKLAVDCIIAPNIEIDGKARGRVTVIESHNDRGPTKIKGGFSLSDYDDMFGNAAEFLTDRGLQPLGEPTDLDAAENVATDGTSDEEEPSAVEPRDEDIIAEVDADDIEEIVEDMVEEPDTSETDAPQALQAPEHDLLEEEEEQIEDPLSLSIDDIDELMEEFEASSPVNNGDDIVQPKLLGALERIRSCYDGADLPPAVDELEHLIGQRDYDQLRSNISSVWTGLIGFHNKRGIRPNHKVTHAFNQIHELLQP